MTGIRVPAAYPASIVTINLGLNITSISHGNRVGLGIAVDPDIVSDPWLIAGQVPAALAELMAAARLEAADTINEPFPLDRTSAPAEWLDRR